MLALGLLSTALANVVTAYIAGRVSASAASAPIFLIPVVSVILGIAVRGEWVPGTALLGGAVCVLAALLLAQARLSCSLAGCSEVDQHVSRAGTTSSARGWQQPVTSKAAEQTARGPEFAIQSGEPERGSRAPALNGRTAAMMMEWDEYRKQLIATIQQIGQASPDIVRGYRTIADGAAKIGKLDPKVRELISLAVAVTARCDGCIVTHVDAAVRHGATKEELIEALGVAISVNAGAALVYSARTLDAFAARTSPTGGT
jgi:AhpD family alkylhydroperoxidase